MRTFLLSITIILCCNVYSQTSSVNFRDNNGKLIINNNTILSSKDSIALKKELEALFLKYRINHSNFKIFADSGKAKFEIINSTTYIQKIDSGGRGFQNNAPNSGIQSLGDVTIQADQEWQLGDVYKGFILRKIEKMRADSNITSKVILFGKTTNSNAPLFTSQLREFLIQSGYDLNHMTLINDESEIDGVSLGTTTLEDNKTPCLNLRVGTLRH
ncbi:MAG TPA: hypothetical protein VK705_12000 [Ferruginibacter sp.]|jgi:hypothetical protein|nr:hypothetical protein [Ferruginibacter sp.]